MSRIGLIVAVFAYLCPFNAVMPRHKELVTEPSVRVNERSGRT